MDPWGDFLSTLRIDQLGAGGLVVLAVLMLFTGKLVPKSQMDAWRDAYLKEKDVGDELRAQVTDLTQAMQVTARVLDALPTSGGDSDVATTIETLRRKRQGGG